MSEVEDKEDAKRTKKILKYHDEHDLNNTEIAKLVDCSRENVRQTLERYGRCSPVSHHEIREKFSEYTIA